MATGIKDKVAIIGMGCTKFGERWEVGAEELMVEAFEEAIEDAGIDRDEIQAAWLGTCMEEVSVGKSALPLSLTLRLPKIPVTRVENYCATGTEAFRGACYAVASGAYDIALALGVEKLKDIGYGGLPNWGANAGTLTWQWMPNITAPGAFAQLASAYAAKHGIAETDLKRAMAHVSAKSHANAVLNPKAHLRKAVTVDQVMASPIIAYPLGLFDCCGVSDGAACAIVTTPEIARGLGKRDLVTVKALQLALSSGEEMGYNDWDGDHFVTTSKCSTRAYEEAGITQPPPGDQHDGSPRLLFHHRTGDHGGPAHLGAGRGGQGCDGRLLQPGRRHPLPARRRAKVLWPSHRRIGAADAVRDVPPAARAGRRAADCRPALWPDPQPGRHATHEYLQRHDRGQIRAVRTKDARQEGAQLESQR